MTERLDGCVALVTGASRGIGAAVAVELGRLGAQVVATARTQGGLDETDDAIRAAGGQATLLPLDLREANQIDAIGPTLYQRFGRLDVLVHNAGVLGRLTPVSHIMNDDWADVVGVNLNAALHLIRTCDPLLRRAPAGRAVFVTDASARQPAAYWAAIGATKAAMENLVLSWAQELARSQFRANLFDPGPVRTRMRLSAFPGEDPRSLPMPEDVAPALVRLCLPSELRTGALVAAG
jgi:NAD(P)-dependent dehydrogenase (short-subunit alcohol dehydrogenase family)